MQARSLDVFPLSKAVRFRMTWSAFIRLTWPSFQVDHWLNVASAHFRRACAKNAHASSTTRTKHEAKHGNMPLFVLHGVRQETTSNSSIILSETRSRGPANTYSLPPVPRGATRVSFFWFPVWQTPRVFLGVGTVVRTKTEAQA